MGAAERVTGLVAPLVADAGLELYDVELTGGALRVLVQRAGGVDVDALADASRRISRVLDEEDPLPGAYTLEVSSPGLERPLRTEAHWSGAVGDAVSVKLRAGVEGDRRIDGVVAGVEAGRAVLALADGSTRTVALDTVERARTRFEWQAAPKPGGPKGRQPGQSKGQHSKGQQSKGQQAKQSKGQRAGQSTGQQATAEPAEQQSPGSDPEQIEPERSEAQR